MVTKPLLRDEISAQLRHLAYARRSAKPLRIGSERELARRFNVSRLSLRAAIKSLVDEGLLFQKQGSGTYILPRTSIDTIHLLEASDIKPYDPFYSEFLAELSRFIAGESMHLKVIHPEGEKVEPSEAPLIIVGLCSSRLLIELKKNYRYIVSTQSYPDALEITQVYFDDYRIGATAAGILNELGHRRVVHLSGPAIYPSAVERKRGFLDGARVTPLTVEVIEGKMNWSSGYAFGNDVVKLVRSNGRPSAIFAANDWMAIGLMQRLLENGVRIPQDVSVVGCDDIHLASEVTPGLATFRWGMRYLVQEVFKLINALILRDTGLHKRILLPAEFISRESLDGGK